MLSREEEAQKASRDPEYVRRIGKEISQLIREEFLEEARERLERELQTNPDELGFLNLLMIINVMDRKFGDFSEAKKLGSRIMELAVEQDNVYYTNEVAIKSIIFNNGEPIFVWGKDNGKIVDPTPIGKIEGNLTFQTPSQRLAYLNTTKGWTEATYNVATGEYTFKVYTAK